MNNTKENKKEYDRKYYQKNKDRLDILKKEYRLKNKDNYKKWTREWSLKNNYGITLDQFNSMRKQQNYRCAIPTCDRHESEFKNGLCVDHNHTTGRVRELLCINCNSAFGKVNEDINILYSLIDYKIKHNKKDN